MHPEKYPALKNRRSRPGKREDLGIFVRSSWEANYARYLNWLKARGDIKEWAFEPKTFEFDKIKKGTRFYTPDFLITENDGTQVFHEVKGYMDPKSITKLKRMAKYHPTVKLVVIDRKAYVELKNKMSALIPNWEQDGMGSKRR